MKLAITIAAGLASFAFAEAAQAATPTLLGVGQQSRHPTATFTMPGADYATVSVATQPDRATDGNFLQENIKDFDILTTDEIQSGSWLGESQLDPGTYYVLLGADDYDCSGDPTCSNAFSNMLSLTIPKPKERFRGSVKNYRYLSIATLTLKVTPVGERLPYRVCWRQENKHRKCARGTVKGYSWNSSASDSVDVRTRRMPKRPTFTWYAGTRKIATRRGHIVTVR